MIYPLTCTRSTGLTHSWSQSFSWSWECHTPTPRECACAHRHPWHPEPCRTEPNDPAGPLSWVVLPNSVPSVSAYPLPGALFSKVLGINLWPDIKKNEIMPFAAAWICHTEWSKSDRGEIYDIPYMWNPKRNDTNELTYKTETDS